MSQERAPDRLDVMDDSPTIIIGGGLAGLTAAATLAHAGLDVTVVEGAASLGGRARSRHRDGFDLNVGPHALYLGVGGAHVLRQLGVSAPGRRPPLHRLGALAGDELISMPRLLARVGQRVQLTRLLVGRGRRRAAELAGTPASTWVEQALDDPLAVDVAASVLRTATYSADHELLDAGAAACQLRAAATSGVRYLDGGWSTLVTGLAARVRAGGGEIRTGVPAIAVEHDERVRAVRLADGSTLRASAVVVAVADPRRAVGLLDGPGAARLAGATAATVPLRMAHLDVALRPLPSPSYPNLLGLDRPVYLTVQSSVARVAPRGGAVIHVGRYLRPDEGGDHRHELEHVLDVAQPGWRDHVVDARYVPRSLVSGDHTRVATRGAHGRPRPDAAGVIGLALAGDWIGPDGTLADASIMSGRAAAASMMEVMRTSAPAAVAA